LVKTKLSYTLEDVFTLKDLEWKSKKTEVLKNSRYWSAKDIFQI
jgi:hypothetical protein